MIVYRLRKASDKAVNLVKRMLLSRTEFYKNVVIVKPVRNGSGELLDDILQFLHRPLQAVEMRNAGHSVYTTSIRLTMRLGISLALFYGGFGALSGNCAGRIYADLSRLEDSLNVARPR